MIKVILMIAAFMSVGMTAVYSQADSTRYIFGLPVTDDDTARHFPPRDFEPNEKLIPVKPSELPGQVYEALEKGKQYAGWQDTTVYHDINTGLYVVPVKYEDGIRIFGLNANGDAVTFSEVSDVEDR